MPHASLIHVAGFLILIASIRGPRKLKKIRARLAAEAIIVATDFPLLVLVIVQLIERHDDTNASIDASRCLMPAVTFWS